MTGSNTACSSSPLIFSRAPYRKDLEHHNTSDCPAELGRRDTILGVNGQRMSKDPETVIAHKGRRRWNKTGHSGCYRKSKFASRMNRRFAKNSRKKRNALNSSFTAAVNKSEEFASEFKTVEDRLRISSWVHRRQRYTRRAPKRRILVAVLACDNLRIRQGSIHGH